MTKIRDNERMIRIDRDTYNFITKKKNDFKLDSNNLALRKIINEWVRTKKENKILSGERVIIKGEEYIVADGKPDDLKYIREEDEH